jgi:plastocyanin
MRLRWSSAALLRFQGLFLAIPTILAGSACALRAGTVDVHIIDFDFANSASGIHFDPTISLGDTVHWILDSGFHSTTSAAGLTESWDSDVHSPTSPPFTFDHTFSHVGDFAYYCSVHGFDNGNGTTGGMAGVVHVLAVPEPASGLLVAVGMAGLFRLARQRCRS